MDENYIGQLRQTILSHRKISDTKNKGNSRLNLECYKSENVFEAPSKHDRKETPHSKVQSEKRKATSESSDESLVLGYKQLQSRKLISKKKKAKKRHMQTFSSDSDDDSMSLIPSRSETDASYISNSSEKHPSIKQDLQDTQEISSNSDGDEEILIPPKNEIKPIVEADVYEISSDGDSEDFNLDKFFCTRDQSISEPLESHAEFDFISDYIKEVKISNKKIYDHKDIKRSKKYLSSSEQSTPKKDRKYRICKENFEVEVQKDTKPDLSSLSHSVSDHIRNQNLEAHADNHKVRSPKWHNVEGLPKAEQTDLYIDKGYSKLVENCIEIDDDDDEQTNTSLLFKNTEEDTATVSSTGFSALIQENKIYSEESSQDAENAEKYFQSAYEIRKPKAEYYSLDDDKIVVLKRNSSLPFFGLFKMKVLYGKVEILGYTLNEQSKPVNVYSPRGSAWLYIKNVTNTTDSNLKDFLPFLKSHECLQKVRVDENNAVVRCSRLNDNKIRFIEKYISQQIFPDDISSNMPQVAFEPRGSNNVVMAHQRWDEVVNQIGSDTKFMVTGGKGVGKSTFVRYTINRLLNKFKKVRVIDLDPGQSMFTAPGMVSVLEVSQPILGPSYTHLMQTERSYISSVDVGRNPFVYVKSVKSLMDYVTKLANDIPTVINYMGFVQNLGLHIISSVITYIKPTDVVQISSKQKKKNFKESLSINLIKENYNIFGHDSIDFEFRLHEFNAMNDNSGGWTLESRQMRELCILAYLAVMLPPNVISLTSNQLPMYKVKLSTLKLMNLKSEELSCAEINANLVALCDKEYNTDLFICYGYGIVRGIDKSSDYIVLLTPVGLEFLEKVLYLVQGDVSLPPSVYMTPDEVIGKVPYVMQGELVSLAQITKRSYIPANKR